MRHELLKQVAGILLCVAITSPALAEETAEQVIQPDIERRQVSIPRINADDFVLSAFVGMFSVEEFSTRRMYGLRLGYHITEDFFVEGEYVVSDVTDDNYRNFIPGGIFPTRVVPLNYYSLSVGYNLFPGEIFYGGKTALSSYVYLLMGIGNTNFVNKDFYTFNAGLGVTVMPWERFALHLRMRDYMMNNDLLGTPGIKHNFALEFGISVLF